MRQILDHTMREESYEDAERGVITKQVVHTVNYIDHSGALHGLVFHPVGENVAGDEESEPRIVGDAVPHYSFTDPKAAVDAYENGEVV